MFFSWYKNNKSFKKGHDIKAQVVPLLIIVMVVLLIAAIATINIGRVALDKTATDNASDAGALASATGYAGAFNGMASFNYTALWATYCGSWLAMYGLYNEGDEVLDMAIIYTATALAAATACYIVLQVSVPLCPYATNYAWLGAAVLALAAMAALVLAAAEVNKFITVCNYMRSVVDAHYTTEKTAFNSVCSSMITSRESSVAGGNSYAFGNSNISSKLSTAQQEAFKNWLEGGPSGTYPWSDKYGQSHSVSVSVDVPAIDSYSLQKTNMDYTPMCDLLDSMISTAKIIIIIYGIEAALCTMAATWMVWMTWQSSGIMTMWYEGIALMATVYGFPAGLALCLLALFNCIFVNWPNYLWAVGWTFGIVTAIGALTAAGAGITLWFLKDTLEKVFDGFDRDGEVSVSGCDLGDILLVKIASVSLSSWETTCGANQKHPGSSSGLISTNYPTTSSGAKATFDKNGLGGEGIGSFSQEYDSELTSAY